MKVFIIAVLMIVLGACAPTDTDNGNTLPTPTREGDTSANTDITGDPGSGFGLGDADSDATNFSGTIDGAITATITGAGSINCENNVYVIRADMSSFPQISLILPANPETGVYTLENNLGDGSVASATVFFADGSTYATGVEGVLTIDSLATAPDQLVAGSFDFSATNGSGVINARGQFSFVSGDDAIYCPS